MTAAPKTSVVIPTYNAARTLTATLRSVAAQRVRDFEVVVVDDGSTDDTLEVARAFADERVTILAGAHAGAAAARNRGIAASRGDVVCFLDSDDLWLPDYLGDMVEALSAQPHAGFAFTDAWVMDDATGRIRKTSVIRSPVASDPPSDPTAFLTSLLRANFVFASVAVPRAVLELVGGFDESLSASIDYELWLRIAAHGRPGIRVPGRLAVYRADRGGSISSSRARVVQGMMAVYGLAADTYPIQPEQRALARQLLAEKHAEYASLTGARDPRSYWLRVKPRLADARDRLLSRREGWFEEPPPELAAILPRLLAGEEPVR